MKPNISLLRERAQLLRELREFFDSRGFLEVQTPCLASDCVVDAHVDPILVDSKQLQIGGVDLPPYLFLQTSPESAMKRLLAAGAPSIYSIGPVFRAGEQGRLHNVEFTMLEWYELGGDQDSGIQLLGDLAKQMLQHERCDVHTYRQTFQSVLEFDPIAAPTDVLRERVSLVDATIVKTLGDDRDAMLDVLMSELIQPTLGQQRPVIIKNYPIAQAALARAAPDDPACAARFELFAGGVELANGYDELTDADELAARGRTENEKRVAAGRRPLLVETKLHQAMIAGLPRAAGVALGIDRLLMLRSGADSIDQVIPLTIDRV